MSLLSLWPHWLRPFWLLLIPLFLTLLWLLWHREKRSGRWQQLLPVAFHSVLLSGGQGRSSRTPIVLLGCAWLLGLLAMLGPSWQQVEQNNLKPADPLVVILELSPQMLASDVTPTRLEHAKRKIIDLLQIRKDAQTALVVFAGSAHTVVPLSDDLGTSRNLLESLKPEIMPEPGHRADMAVEKAQQLLKQGAQGQGRLLLVVSELNDSERQNIASTLGTQGQRLSILGIGTQQGAPIVQADGGFLKDAQGAIMIPRLDSSSLARFATSIGAQYRQSRLDDLDLSGLGLLGGPQKLREEGEKQQLQVWADQGHWLVLALVLLAAFAGRRGWIFCVPLLLLSLPQNSYAFGFDDLWLRPDQQGQRLLEAQRPAEAAKRFSDPQWQGQALYQAGDYAGAAERFAQSDSAAAHYNRGNALARSNEYEAAIEAYEQALDLQPDLAQAQQNKALIEQLLQQQQQSPQNQQDSQQQDSQNSQENSQQGSEQNNSQAQSTADAQNADGSTDDQASEQSPGQDQAADSQQDGQSAEQSSAGDDAGQPDAQAAQQQAQQDQATQAAADKLVKSTEAIDGERRQSLEQWLRQIPDDPGELLKRKFWYEQQQRQENPQ
ncbi:MAG: hypothetical protein CMK71_03140 [Pseudomonadaceae bacterium]|nr:hypothetical protein [Pseudomonadaceae bacterium]